MVAQGIVKLLNQYFPHSVIVCSVERLVSNTSLNFAKHDLEESQFVCDMSVKDLYANSKNEDIC